ncbi:glycosyltransferase family 2 protein [Virgibacillus salarius]|uniref:glycosyltransferase family 2 protein n=1 Tax=Virgibacillus salarius TaxID=447199 RepID=UPI0024913144|nr:glycosyltransferase family 2 protein [Virgibacillus salarius]WBX81422.1 glycosyltransferase family 2 protein [Virgibacillus salarius]
MIRYSIVIPCYNEAKNIPALLARWEQVMERKDVEILLVNNGSKDESSETLQQWVPQYSFAQRLEIEVNRGYGYGILYGLSHARGEFLGWTHADLQTDPLDVIKAMEVIDNSPSPQHIFVKGNRKNRPLFDQLFTGGMSLFESLYLKQKLRDINAQPNVFHRSFYLSWSNPPNDFSLDLYAFYMARKADLEIHRFAVVFPDRLHGESSWNNGLAAKVKFIKRTLDFSTTLKKELAR